ncbi:MAG: hypothetical protein IT299_12370 [Dehalococcoidia bacterium]|nr:hypothetical protein [Dehalococcoidia bacterium]
MTAHHLSHPSRLDAAIARGDLEVVALRLALGVAVTLEEWRSDAAATREDLIALVSGIGERGLR